MTGALKALLKRHWPQLRLRTILLAVLLFVAALPVLGAVFLRVYENTLVRQTESELVAQGAVLSAAARALWPDAAPERLPPRTDPAYYRPEQPTIDLSSTPVWPERPAPAAGGTPDPRAATVATAMTPIIEQTGRTTLASIVMTDGRGVAVYGPGPVVQPGSYAALPEIQTALSGRPVTVLRTRNEDYSEHYAFEWLSRAADLRIHHARPVIVNGRVEAVLLLSRSPRALFRGVYQDRGKLLLGLAVIVGLLVILSALVSRGVTRPIEALSRASKEVASGQGEVPPTPTTAAKEIQQLYEDYRAMAEAIARRSRYLRDFAAAVSHEFKTPLAGIGGAAELLDDHFETMTEDERRRFLANILADTERLSQLVTRLLDLARADMAQPQAGLSTALAPPLRRIADAVAADGFQVRLALPEGLPDVAAPEASVEAVLTAVLENARQAGAGEARITARADEGAVTLTVQDNGPGIPEADRQRLFEPFFTSRRESGGTGLGLSIARSLLSAHQGAIHLAPSDRGARFDITLPFAAAP